MGAPIDFKESQVAISVELVTRRVPNLTNFRMSYQLLLMGIELKAEVTYVQALTIELLRKRREIPAFDPILPKVYRLYGLNFGLSNEFLDLLLVHPKMLVIIPVSFFIS